MPTSPPEVIPPRALERFAWPEPETPFRSRVRLTGGFPGDGGGGWAAYRRAAERPGVIAPPLEASAPPPSALAEEFGGC